MIKTGLVQAGDFATRATVFVDVLHPFMERFASFPTGVSRRVGSALTMENAIQPTRPMKATTVSALTLRQKEMRVKSEEIATFGAVKTEVVARKTPEFAAARHPSMASDVTSSIQL